MKKIIIILIVSLVSCRSKEEKFIQTEFDKIIGQWKVQTFTVTGNAPDSLKTFIKSCELLFIKCPYKKKDFSVCGGDIDINGIVFANTYKYNYATKLFQFSDVGASGENPRKEMVLAARNGNLLLQGDWQLTVTENTLTAKQVNNYHKIDASISYTATRK
jgi:hypothetical protein